MRALFKHWWMLLTTRRTPWRYDKMTDGTWTFRREKTCRVCGHTVTIHTEVLSQGKLREVIS